jgi:NAD(P)-dependent dehydrogenase (short-subunit alcohol dehydrogenase family)
MNFGERRPWLSTPMPLAAAYTASKMAIEGFTGSLASQLLKSGQTKRRSRLL